MNSVQNVWNLLAKSSFDTHIKGDLVDPRSADNILIAWPPIVHLIQTTFPSLKEIRILDFGCGTGGFCLKLNNLGYKVTGIDSSKEMIDIAKRNLPESVTLLLGDQSSIPVCGQFNVIVSIMTLQFIENLTNIFHILINALLPGGLLIIADFNKEWVKECLKIPISFRDFDSNINPHKGWKTFGALKTPVYIREAEEYDLFANHNSLDKILEVRPPFSDEFINKYPDKRPKHLSEYLILAYHKGSST